MLAVFVIPLIPCQNSFYNFKWNELECLYLGAVRKIEHGTKRQVRDGGWVPWSLLEKGNHRHRHVKSPWRWADNSRICRLCKSWKQTQASLREVVEYSFLKVFRFGACFLDLFLYYHWKGDMVSCVVATASEMFSVPHPCQQIRPRRLLPLDSLLKHC